MPNTVANSGVKMSMSKMKCPAPVSNSGQTRWGNNQRGDHGYHGRKRFGIGPKQAQVRRHRQRGRLRLLPAL